MRIHEYKKKKTQHKKKISLSRNFSIRLTALDPAGPLFTRFSSDAYSKNDFLFVDSIHTSAGLLGEFEIR